MRSNAAVMGQVQKKGGLADASCDKRSSRLHKPAQKFFRAHGGRSSEVATTPRIQLCKPGSDGPEGASDTKVEVSRCKEYGLVIETEGGDCTFMRMIDPGR